MELPLFPPRRIKSPSRSPPHTKCHYFIYSRVFTPKPSKRREDGKMKEDGEQKSECFYLQGAASSGSFC